MAKTLGFLTLAFFGYQMILSLSPRQGWLVVIALALVALFWITQDPA